MLNSSTAVARFGHVLLPLLLLLSVPSVALGQQAKFVRADTYYYGWDVLTRSTLSAEDVRKNARIVAHFIDEYETDRFVRWLNLPANGQGEGESGNPRLVIDLWNRAGQRTTYYADRFRLYSGDGSASRPIDQAFLQRFTFGPPTFKPQVGRP